MKNVIITSELNAKLAPESERWLVIGPCCWGASRSLPLALQNATVNLSHMGGTFTACVIPDGELFIGDDGSYRVEGWTPEQKKRAEETSRVVAVTKSAAQRWGKLASRFVREHAKEIKKDKTPPP